MAAPVTSSTSTTGGDQAAAAAASLQLLLREDPLLLDHGMTEWNPHRPDQAAIPYAAAVLQQSQEPLDHSTTAVLAKERADTALQDVERKLALVESLAVKLSRTSPEAVAGPLMRLHGHGTLVVATEESPQAALDNDKNNQDEDNKRDQNDKDDDKTRASIPSATITTTTLSSLRDRAHRLDRQSQVLETVAQRVQTSLERGLHRMNGACLKLERVLTLSKTLKMMLRAQFESVKLQTYDLTDVRDLTKAAAAVAILQDLWDQPELGLLSSSHSSSSIALVQHWHPPATQTAAAVRQASQTLLHDYCRSQHFHPDEEEEKDGTTNTTKSRMAAMASLGATLQVYFHLGELPQAAWYVVNQAHDQAEAACRQLWNTTTLQHLKDQAASSFSLSSTSSSATKPKKASTSSTSTSGTTEGIAQRLVQLRLEAAEHWARGLAQAMTSVRHLQHVLHSKTDPESRNVFWTVVMTQGPCPPEYTTANNHKTSSTSTTTTLVTESLVTLFWQRTCRTMARLIQQVLHQVSSSHHKTKLDRADVAALYPPVRRVALQLVGQRQEPQSFAMAGTSSTSTGGGGILGGSQALETALAWQSWSSSANGTTTTRNPQEAADEPPHTSSLAADSWTTPPSTTSATTTAGSWASLAGAGGGGLGTNTSASASLSLIGSAAATSASSSSDVASFQCREWKTLLSNDQEQEGLYPLQQAFVQACTQRLCQPLQYMFPDPTHDDDEDEAALILSEDGLPTAATNTATNPSMIPNSSLLPSKFDVQRFDENIRHELSLADPKEGGGEFTAVTMIAECVVNMISQFCLRARNALSKTHHHHHHKHHQLKNYLKLTSAANPVDWTMTEALQHDRKVAAIMYTLHSYLEAGPEKTFVAPYRPTTSPQQEEAAALCLEALQPALNHINKMVQSHILDPLCHASNRRLGDMIARIHLGVYYRQEGDQAQEEEVSTTFVQTDLAPVYEAIANQILTKFPPPYASIVASKIASFSIHAFVSNAALVRPLGESARLHLTQDLADLELALEQLVLRGGGSSSNKSVHLSQIENGRPYAELRAVRQMLFWNGFESKTKSGSDLAKALLREAWIRDLRPSTIIHYLFSYAPSWLSSPHHTKRVKAEEYVFSQLVDYNGSVDHGEEDAWLVTLSCCDAYAQRATTASPSLDGDGRVSDVLLNLGPELLRRQRH